jgi:hypothetical protein
MALILKDKQLMMGVLALILMLGVEKRHLFGSAFQPHTPARFLSLHSHQIWNQRESSASVVLNAATKKKSKKKASAGNGGGFGGAKSSGTKIATSPFDAPAALLRSEKVFEELQILSAKAIAQYNDDDEEEDATKDCIHSEYMIAARYVPSGTSQSGAAALSDWVPVAQLAMMRSSSEQNAKEHVHTSVSHYCREIFHAAEAAHPIFKTFPRNSIQYSAEPLDSFFKFVYEDVIDNIKESKSNQGSETVMTKTTAREILELPADAADELSVIKKTYHKMSMKFHPDRFVATADSMSEEEKNDISVKFGQIKLAYETLNSGIRNSPTSGSSSSLSWYESLGGRERNEFFLIDKLASLDQAKTLVEQNAKLSGYQAAVAGLDPATVMAFVARNQAAARA